VPPCTGIGARETRPKRRERQLMLDRQSTFAASTGEPQAVATSPIDSFDPGGRGVVEGSEITVLEQVSNGYSGSPAASISAPLMGSCHCSQIII
jgi:hypothetical protein